MSAGTHMIKAIFRRLPAPLQRSFWRGKHLLTGCFATLRSWMWPSVSLLDGKEQTEGEALSLLYCGDDTQSRNYICRTTFGPSGEREDLGRMSVLKVRKLLKKDSRPCHAAWIEWNPLSRLVLRPKHALTLPRWIEAWLDVPDSTQGFRKKRGFKDIMRRIRKHGYTYEVTRDKEKFDFFYHRMYGPTIRASHGERAYIISYPFFERLCEHSDLLLVTQEGWDLAGVLIEYEGDDAILAYIGVVDGDRALVEEGILGALDYFSAQWLRSRGHSTISFGGSKPFLDDGVLRTKMKRDCYLRTRTHIRDENIILAAFEESPGLRSFLRNNPLLRYSPVGGVEAVFFADASRTADTGAVEAMIRPYLNYKGIGRWMVYTFDDSSTGVRSVAAPESGANIAITPFRTSKW